MSLSDSDIGWLSVLVNGLLAALAAGTFFAITWLGGDYSWVARIGGATWVFLLSMIILMPTITPWLRKRLEQRG